MCVVHAIVSKHVALDIESYRQAGTTLSAPSGACYSSPPNDTGPSARWNLVCNSERLRSGQLAFQPIWLSADCFHVRPRKDGLAACSVHLAEQGLP